MKGKKNNQRERERERETERQRDRDTERETERRKKRAQKKERKKRGESVGSLILVIVAKPAYILFSLLKMHTHSMQYICMLYACHKTTGVTVNSMSVY